MNACFTYKQDGTVFMKGCDLGINRCGTKLSPAFTTFDLRCCDSAYCNGGSIQPTIPSPNGQSQMIPSLILTITSVVLLVTRLG